MSSYSPEYIAELLNYSSGDIITADEFNILLNKLIHQGDHNSAWLDYLDRVGIPAAVAEIAAGDISEYIAEAVSEEIAQLTADSNLKTTGYIDKKYLCVIDTATGTYVESDNVKVTRWYTPTTGDYEHGVFNAYAGATITALTEEQRVTDGDALTAHLTGDKAKQYKLIYQNKAVPLAASYLRGAYFGYLYNTSGFVNIADLAEYKYNYPVVPIETESLAESALLNTNMNQFLMIAVPYSTWESADRALFDKFVTDNNFVTVYASDLVELVLNSVNLKTNTTVYNTNKVIDKTSDNTVSDEAYINFNGTKIKVSDIFKRSELNFDLEDVMLKTVDELTFDTGVGEDGTTLQIYKAGTLIFEETLGDDNVHINKVSEDVAHPVCVTRTTAGSEKPSVATNVTINNTAKTLSVDGKTVVTINSYNPTTHTLVLNL